MPIILAPGRQKQKDCCELEDSRDIEWPCCKRAPSRTKAPPKPTDKGAHITYRKLVKWTSVLTHLASEMEFSIIIPRCSYISSFGYQTLIYVPPVVTITLFSHSKVMLWTSFFFQKMDLPLVCLLPNNIMFNFSCFFLSLQMDSCKTHLLLYFTD